MPGGGDPVRGGIWQKDDGGGPTYRECQKGRVLCRDFGKEMAAGSLASHRVTQHGRAVEELWNWEASATGGELQTYRMALSTMGGTRSYPLESFPGQAGRRIAMRMHFSIGMSGIS